MRLLKLSVTSPNFYPRVGLLVLCLALCYYKLSLHYHYSQTFFQLQPLPYPGPPTTPRLLSAPSTRYPICPKLGNFLDEVSASLDAATDVEEREQLEAQKGLYTVMQQTCLGPPANQSSSSRGVLYTGAAKHFPSLILSLYSLKMYHKSPLPVEVWCPPEDLDTCRTRLETALPDLTCRALEEGVTGWMSKMAAMQGSRFSQVVFLDADSIPLSDPALLFDLEPFTAHGAVFWPDYWGEACKDVSSQDSIFKGASSSNPIFTQAIAGLTFKEDWAVAQEMESGQMVLDLGRHRALLDVVAYLTRPDTYFQKLLYGDKDAFRYAWLFMQQPFHFLSLPPGHTGYPQDKQAFQRNGIVQYLSDYNHPIFFHQLNMRQPQAFEHVAYPRLDKRPYNYSYCARLHNDYWVWGIDLSQDEFEVTTYEGRYLSQATAMFDFGREKGFW